MIEVYICLMSVVGVFHTWGDESATLSGVTHVQTQKEVCLAFGKTSCHPSLHHLCMVEILVCVIPL